MRFLPKKEVGERAEIHGKISNYRGHIWTGPEKTFESESDLHYRDFGLARFNCKYTLYK